MPPKKKSQVLEGVPEKELEQFKVLLSLPRSGALDAVLKSAPSAVGSAVVAALVASGSSAGARAANAATTAAAVATAASAAASSGAGWTAAPQRKQSLKPAASVSPVPGTE